MLSFHTVSDVKSLVQLCSEYTNYKDLGLIQLHDCKTLNKTVETFLEPLDFSK